MFLRPKQHIKKKRGSRFITYPANKGSRIAPKLKISNALSPRRLAYTTVYTMPLWTLEIALSCSLV